MPMYDEVIARAGIGEGTTVLDVGCGSGSFCRRAADRSARVSGLDASEALLEIARRRVPGGDFRLGDLQVLPHQDDVFDVVTGFNSFQFAVDPVAALREAGRVARPGGTVAAVVWGPPERVELGVLMRAVGSLLPASSSPPGPSLSDHGALEAAAVAAGLTVRTSGDRRSAFEYPDDETMLRGILSSGGAVRVSRIAGETAVRCVVLETMQQFRTAAGGYRLENDWHYVVAAA